MPSKKDYYKGKSPGDLKPWKIKTSKGYGTASGRECYPGRNYGYRWEIRPRFVSGDEETETETETEHDHVDQEHAEDEDYDRHTINESLYEDESESEDSYELQLAKALSLSLETTETDCNAFDFDSLDDADLYSLMETDSEDHDSSDEAEWIDVDGLGTHLECPTYAQMTKVEVT
ncbi:hypothetical protein ACEPAF_7966 [Sanghuangporus sanghuang]|uniref:Uncharacterized protein n=1 Tax=Sanghuangporus baumii TaxID=108892 RepID=A0A9Q5I0H9_SANBA|nr:hypothetical protein A7U60_g3405 [Sanghuangporus baumii]